MTDDLSNRTRRRFLQATGGTAVALGFAGCTGNSGGNESSNGSGGNGGGGSGNASTASGGSSGGGSSGSQTLTIAQAKSPIEFDPVVLNDVPSGQISEQVFDGLYTYKKGTSFTPVIADGTPKKTNGGKKWTVSLKKGPKFQNGDAVTAEDVKYTFLAPVEEDTENATEVEMIDSIDTPDDQTVVFNLKYAYGPFMTTMTRGIVPKKVREQDKKKFNKQNPVGAGPFTFTEFKQGDHVTIERWDDYWGDPMPNLGEVVFNPVEEQTTRVTSLKTGENDFIVTIPPKLWDKVKNMGDTTVSDVASMSYYYLAFNCNDGPTADKSIRKAIGHTFSMDDAVDRYVIPSGVRQYSPLPKKLTDDWGFPANKWKNMAPEKDIDKAKSMLDDSDDVPDDWEATIIVPPDEKRKQIGITVSNGLQEAGYGGNVTQLDWGKFLDTYNTGKASDYNMFTLGWSGQPDPDAFLYYLLSSSESDGGSNGAYYTDEQVSKLIMQGRKSADRSERKKIYTKAVTQILEDLPHIPAYALKNSFAMKSSVQDFQAHSVLYLPLATQFSNVSFSG